MAYIYEQIASSIIDMITQGLLQPGDRLASLREKSQQWGVSINSVKEAYDRLEQWAYIKCKPQSGYFVLPPVEEFKAVPAMDPQSMNPQDISLCRIYSAYKEKKDDFYEGTDLGIATLSPDYCPQAEFRKISREIFNDSSLNPWEYQIPPGYYPLRQAIAKKQINEGIQCSAEQILITNGCHEAMFLVLSKLCQEGDTVVLESPIYFNLYQMLQRLKLKVVEIPSHRESGIPLETLQFILDNYPVKAFITISNFSNPLGFSHCREKKEALMDVLYNHSVPIIEDDIYSNIYFGKSRPDSYYSLKKEDQEIYLCSSVSKIAGPGLRVGWITASHGFEELTSHKTLLNLGAPTFQQMLLEKFFQQGSYQKHCRKLRKSLADNMRNLRSLMLDTLPKGSKITNPLGGMSLWVSLSEGHSSMELYSRCQSQGILIAPGVLFSQRRSYDNSFRICFGRDHRSIQGFEDRLRTALS